jgi:hypothetical protein
MFLIMYNIWNPYSLCDVIIHQRNVDKILEVNKPGRNLQSKIQRRTCDSGETSGYRLHRLARLSAAILCLTIFYVHYWALYCSIPFLRIALLISFKGSRYATGPGTWVGRGTGPSCIRLARLSAAIFCALRSSMFIVVCYIVAYRFLG